MSKDQVESLSPTHFFIQIRDVERFQADEGDEGQKMSPRVRMHFADTSSISVA